MSDDHDLHGAPETSHSNWTLSVIGALGTMLLFGLLIFIAYYVPASDREPATAELVEQRKATLAELKATEANAATSYKVLNKETGQVQIPVEEAMKLVVPQLNEANEK
ncbi:hypothetical protein [Cerasicoccus maritimus]|uniref:hypothetical protein n=1 Tax=Cerasicoccus maritimus TaxID=490089 RepID=UPI002852516B|nr:hypothetical protein [Cerasicoccus maritimus]